MSKGELSIKNDALAQILDRVLKEEDGSPNFEGKTEQEVNEELVATYMLDMVRSGLDANLELDLTLNSIKDLPIATASCYRRYKKGTMPESAIGSTVRSLAAYLLALSMNEHDLPWEIKRTPILVNSPNPPKTPLWAGLFRIEAKGKKNVDFLQKVNEGTKELKLGEKSILIIDLADLIKEYKTITGTDLSKYGLHSIAFDL